MPLSIGARIGSFEVLAPIGSGGMGEVYRANDTKLGRPVALKVLSPALADDADYMARFAREAQVLASLNHPNIATIYGLEESGGVRALVMELVEGSTLAERLAAGTIPLEEALEIARQIADALEFAHEKGIVHRDLKPANVKIAPDGVVKVLDFGLAKTTEAAAPISPNSATLTMRATQAGLIMGTAGYMSPEQAAAKPVDKRADIWSFGVVLWEMLTGRELFSGETFSHTLAHVLTQPIDYTRIPARTPPAIRDLLRRCLDRDPRKRLRDIGEARIAIQKYQADPLAEQPPAQVAPPKKWHGAPWVLAAVASGVALWTWIGAPKPVAGPVVRLIAPMPPPPQSRVRSLTVSRDGMRIAFRSGQESQIYVRASDQLEAKSLSGTENAYGMCFSPDGQWLAFSDNSKIKKIPVSGGAAVILGEGVMRDGASWGPDGDIVFAGTQPGLMRISSAGGLEPDTRKGETNLPVATAFAKQKCGVVYSLWKQYAVLG
jgi:serine/threonine-protein kinase